MPRVLIADDNAQNLYLLEVLLKGNGFDVATTTDGAEALAAARVNPPDIIVTDILMPVMDGFSLCRAWKADERLKTIPFIFYTATYTEQKDEEFALSLGADRFVVKPQEPEVLMRIISEVLSERNSVGLVPADPCVGEETFLRQYNETLFNKLEKKIAELERNQTRLQREIVERDRAEEDLRQMNRTLEDKVTERTALLVTANQRLENEIQERIHAEAEVVRLNQDLQKRVQTLENLNNELKSFSYSVSHDLRAPLRSINGFSAILMEDYNDQLHGVPFEYLQRIRRSVEKMDDLINALLDLSRVSLTEMSVTAVDLSPMVQEIADSLREEEADRSVTFTIAEGVCIRADRTLIRAVLENLLRNAWKYSRQTDHPIIEFGSFRQGETIVCFVRDNGIGFNMQYADDLFRPFQRFHRAETIEGAGVGLATVRRIINRHGGKVWGEGGEGEGATFYFSIPECPINGDPGEVQDVERW